MIHHFDYHRCPQWWEKGAVALLMKIEVEWSTKTASCYSNVLQLLWNILPELWCMSHKMVLSADFKYVYVGGIL